jgi:hypothetical protein
VKYVILDEVAFTENELDFLRMEGVITIVKQEIETSELEEKIVKKNLRPWKMWVVSNLVDFVLEVIIAMTLLSHLISTPSTCFVYLNF